MKDKLEKFLKENYEYTYGIYKDKIEIKEVPELYNKRRKELLISIYGVDVFRIKKHEMQNDACVSVYGYCIMKVAINAANFRRR